MTQREDPEAQVSIAMTKVHLAMRHGPGSKFSGAPIIEFKEGWALPAFHYGAVHHLRIVGDEFVARCGWRATLPRVRGQGVVFLGQGDFKRCKLCQRKVDRTS